MKFLFLGAILLLGVVKACDPCYNQNQNENCRKDEVGLDSYTLHMTVHPHLDAFWIFDFQSYYNPKPNQGDVLGYFASNRFTSVKDIFTIAKDNLWESKNIRETVSNKTQKAHRSFVNSEMGFFKRWYSEQNPQEKQKVKELLKTKYWEILGGGYVQQDEGCAYYDSIIENFELGLHFLKEEFNYYPKVAVAADSFGHSQGSLAILAHLGIEGYFVERSDEHILLQNKTEFVWRAKSANGKVYGALPTHIRWAIHGFQDQFIGSNVNQNFCQSKEPYMRNLRNQNQFLKRILKSNHIMRYFGHDFQKFDNYSYSVIESMMKKFSMEKCNKVVALYGNPTEYFMALMGQVYGKKVKPVVTRSEDIFPIWDYDSGLYWTGYFTTDAYHKKDYRDLGRFLHGVRKIFANMYLEQPQSDKNKKYYQQLEEMAEQVSYLQHHDGISGTSKYTVMDKLEKQNEEMTKKVTEGILKDAFADQFPKGTNGPIFQCHLGKNCKIPETNKGDVYLKIINTDGNPVRDPVIVQVPIGHHYTPDCDYEINCFCFQETCPCKLYLYKLIYTFTSIRLKKVDQLTNPTINRLTTFTSSSQYSFSKTHFNINQNGKNYSLGYKRVTAKGTPRRYDHLSRYGNLVGRSFNIRPGKYALGNDPATVIDFSEIKRVSQLQSQRMLFFLVEWKRYQMKTFISIPKNRPNQWTVDTITATQGYYLSDVYFEVITPIDNKNQFVTDSNGWVTVKRELFKHQDYSAFFCQEKYDDLDGNSYPSTAFVYLEDQKDKVSVNVERPQGVVAYRSGTIWINFDRLSEDDGKWVYESAVRSEYQKYTHIVTAQNKDYNERRIQRQYDQPLFIQGNTVSPSERIEQTEVDVQKRNQWNQVSNLDNVKFMIRPFNDSTTVLRVHNLHDSDTLSVGLFADKVSPLLTTYYARTVTFDEITQASLGANMPYSKFLNDKWNWNKVMNLTFENQIFNKEFKENITLRPLEIRTFIIKNMKFAEKCIEVKELKYNQQGINYTIDLNKPMPIRDPLSLELEKEVIYYNQHEDHCEGKSPILDESNVTNIQPGQTSKNDQIFKANTVANAPVESHNEAQNSHDTKYATQAGTSSTTSPPPPLKIPGDHKNLQQILSSVKSKHMLSRIEKELFFTSKLTDIKNKKKAKSS